MDRAAKGEVNPEREEEEEEARDGSSSSSSDSDEEGMGPGEPFFAPANLIQLRRASAPCVSSQLKTIRRSHLLVKEQENNWEGEAQKEGLRVLPTECALKVLGLLPPRDLLSFTSTSRWWRDLARRQHVWRKRYEAAFPPAPPSAPAQVPRHLASMPWPARLMLREAYERNWRTRNFTPVTIFQRTTDWWTTNCPTAVSCLKFCDNILVTGSVDKIVKIWNLDTMTCPNTLFGHEGALRCLQFDEERIVTGADDNRIKFWDIKTGLAYQTLKGHTNRVCGLQYDDNVLASCSQDLSVRLWAANSGDSLSVLQGHSGAVWCLSLLAGTLVTGSADQKIKVWDLEKQICKSTLSGHTACVASVQLDSCHLIASASLDKTVRVWDVRDLSKGKCQTVLVGHAGPVGCVQFENNKIASGSADETLKIWDLGKGRCLSTLPQQSPVVCLQFEAHRLALGTRKTLRVFDYRQSE